MKYLLENNADQNIKNIEGKLARDYALELNNLRII
jgi:hypothetical protein